MWLQAAQYNLEGRRLHTHALKELWLVELIKLYEMKWKTGADNGCCR